MNLFKMTHFIAFTFVMTGCGIHSYHDKMSTETAVLESNSKTGPFKSEDIRTVTYRGQFDTCLNEHADMAGREQYCEETVLAGRTGQPPTWGYYPNMPYVYGNPTYGQTSWYTTPSNGPAVIR